MTSTAIPTQCERLTAIDTPGTNSMKDKLEHNVWIAAALNSQPVSLILSVVKADPRMDNVVEAIRRYAESFVVTDLFGICVTHMDTVKWTPAEFLPRLNDELGIDRAVFVGLESTTSTVINDIYRECRTPKDLTIDSDNFFKFFQITNNNIKILKTVRDEVGQFKTINHQFLDYLTRCDEQDRVDAAFEFQAFMTEQIVEAQKRVAEANGFTFMGSDCAVANELGHHANLTNQLASVLFQVRTMTLGYAANHGVDDVRKCPHCGLVWAKIEGCDGSTTCGNLMKQPDKRFSRQMGTFAFAWDKMSSVFRVTKRGLRPAKRQKTDDDKKEPAKGVGCGGSIIWSSMAPQSLPSEFREVKEVAVDDVKVVPEMARPTWKKMFGEILSKIGAVRKHRPATG